MPNYKLSETYTYNLETTATRLIDRMTDQLCSEFPLTSDEIAAGLLPAEDRAILQQLARKYTDNSMPFYRRSYISLCIAHETIPRPAVISLNDDSSKFIVTSGISSFDMQILDADRQKLLIDWANKAVREARIAKFTKNTVHDFIKNHADCTGHILARWPTLTLLTEHMNKPRSYISTWKARFHDKPRSLKRYEWPAGALWPQRNKRAIELTDVTLTTATMMMTSASPSRSVRVISVSWVPAPGDPDKP